jgi:Ca2+-binding EF-hand superfamily protein
MELACAAVEKRLAVPNRSLIYLIATVLAVSSSTAFAQNQKKAPPNPPAAAGPQPLSRTTFLTEMDSQFRLMDADKNGLLTRTEIEQFQKLAAVAEAQARNRSLFAQLDADKNGQISALEFRKLIASPTPANAGPMLSREDGNRDQQISLVEHRVATLANFDRLDADKDGIVTSAEMKAGGITPR